MDPDLARRIADREDAGLAADGAGMTPLGYTPEMGLLTSIAEGVVAVRNVLIDANGGSAPPFEALPRPQTALDVERAGRIRTELMEIDRMLRGG